MRRVFGFLASLAALAVAGPVSAAETIALFTGTGANVAGNAINKTNSGVKVQVTAWTSTTAGYWNTNNGHIRSTLGQWSHGIGSQYSNGDSHTVDNTDRVDFILLQFDTAVALNTVTFTSGWSGYDSDATISRANVNYAALGSTYKTTNNSFWNAAAGQLRTNMVASDTPNNTFQTGVVNTSKRQVNAQLTTSNVWVISAKIGNTDTYRDAFKIKGFTYIDPYNTGGAVPEPATWAMLILGMGAIGGAMRRQARMRLAFAG